MIKMERQSARGLRLFSCLLALLTLFFSAAPRTFAAQELSAIKGSSALLADAQTGYVLYEQNADEQIIPASTTKVLTAMLIIEAVREGKLSLDEKVEAKQEVIDGVIFDASRISPYITNTELLTVKEYLYCIMLASDCVACDILANRVAGSVDEFVSLMNERASELGCEGTHFVNTHGYPQEGHYATARSLYLITAQAIQYEEFREIFGTIKLQLPETNLGNKRMLYNTNWTIWDPEKISSIYCKYYYEYATGGKTGSSASSGYCLVSTAEKDGRTLISVVTGAKIETDEENDESWNRSFTETARLFKWGFENFSEQQFAKAGDIVSYVTVSNADVDYVDLKVTQDIKVFIDKESNVDQLESNVVLYNNYLNAPVSSGDLAGELRVCDDKGEPVITVQLVCAKDVPAKEKSGVGWLIWVLALLLVACAIVAVYIYFDTKDPAGMMEFRRKLKLTVQLFFPNAFKDKKNGYKSNPSGYYTRSNRPAQNRAEPVKKEYYDPKKRK